MAEEPDYEGLSSNAGLGANMLAGALVSPSIACDMYLPGYYPHALCNNVQIF